VALHNYLVTLTAAFAPGADAPDNVEAAMADALMRLPETATVRIEYAPETSVCRLDASGEDSGQAEAATEATVRQVVDRLGVQCRIESVVAVVSNEGETPACRAVVRP
jgi:uncharacterized protein (DUF1501 family)